jgi:hypothetical protein
LYSYLWSEAGAQSSFEESFGLTFGYPALVAFSLDKVTTTALSAVATAIVVAVA